MRYLCVVWGVVVGFGCGSAESSDEKDSSQPVAGQAAGTPSSGSGGAAGSAGTNVPVAGMSNAGTSAGSLAGDGSSGASAAGEAGTSAGSAGTAGNAGAAGVAGSAGQAGEAGTNASVPCATPEEETFSFFLISYDAIQRESGGPQGFGGDLGGITGADDICLRVALSSSDCAGNKTWRAFLSTTTEHAIDRIGQGPWHDRVGRVFAEKLEDLLADRPTSADPAIIDDLPNEFGIPNHNPDGLGEVDNHQILTGSGIDGKLYTQTQDGIDMMGMPGGFGGGFGSMTSCTGGWTREKATCWDWTRSDSEGCPRVGHSWPRQGSGINWISVWNEGGCAPGVTLDDRTAPDGMSVGSFGGYGGWYCFAVTP